METYEIKIFTRYSIHFVINMATPIFMFFYLKMTYDCAVFAFSHLSFSVLVRIQSQSSFCSFYYPQAPQSPVSLIWEWLLLCTCVLSHTRSQLTRRRSAACQRPPAPCSAGSWRNSRSQGSVLCPYWPQGRFLESQQRKQQKAQKAAKQLCPSVRMFLRKMYKEVFLKERPVGVESIFTLWLRVFANWFSQRWVLALSRFYWYFENCKRMFF